MLIVGLGLGEIWKKKGDCSEQDERSQGGMY